MDVVIVELSDAHGLLMHKDYARTLRKNMTDAEQKFWYFIRNRRLCGYKFRRQVAIGNYVVDFLCVEAKLIVELDGCQHLAQMDYDFRRTDWLGDQGYAVLRFWNEDVLVRTAEVLEYVVRHLKASH